MTLPSGLSGCSPAILVQFINCRIIFNNEIIKEDFWVRDGKILNPEKIFFTERKLADLQIDCQNHLIVPGYIDVQINGGFGYDFSSDIAKLTEGLNVVSKGVLKHGVTSFCPTLVTSSHDVYKEALPKLKKKLGGKHGAEILGAHCEGPFINPLKKGAHNIELIKPNVNDGINTLKEMYGSFENITIMTMAPELPGALDCIPSVVAENVIVSIGHCIADLTQGEAAVCKGASFITHLFNAMSPFHHRDPGIVGVLTSMITPKQAFYGLISDGIHTHPTALRIAHRSHPNGIVLVTDAMAALGLPPGIQKIGTMDVVISQKEAKIAGTNTLAGSICSMDRCVRHFRKGSGCSTVEAIKAATLHPAQLLAIEDCKGTLNYNTDADFVIVNDDLFVQATFIAGELVWLNKENFELEHINQHY